MRSVQYAALLPGLVRLAAAASSAGCGSDYDVPTLNARHNATLANSNRTYMYWLPPSYDQNSPAPLILSFHGVGQSPVQEADLDLLGDTFFNTGQIVVYPQASKPDGEKKVIWQGPPDVEVDDVSFVMDLLDELEANLCIDTRRMYATGKSEGGGFVGTLACNATSAARIAAFAPVSGAFYIDADCDDPDTVAIPCDPGRCNVPVLEFHGGADFLVSIDGGERRSACLPSIKHYMENWAELDGLNSTAPAVVYNITSAATVSKYDEAGTVTFVYDGDDVKHDWPFTVATTDTAMDRGDPATFNATSIILEWFGNFTLPYVNAASYVFISHFCRTEQLNLLQIFGWLYQYVACTKELKFVTRQAVGNG